MPPRVRMLAVVVLCALAATACTVIVLNKAPVSITESDNHSATNGRTVDLTISPR